MGRIDIVARQQQCTGRDCEEHDPVPHRPQPALPVQIQPRLDQQRIGDQSAETADIGCGIQRIGVTPPRRGGEPALQQRRLCRDREEQRPDRCAEQPGHPHRRFGIRRQLHRHQAQRQPQCRNRQHAQMDHRLPSHRHPAEQMGIGIAPQQQRLIDQHRAVPHRWRPTQPGQRHARDHRLDQKQQETADQDGQDE